MYTQDCVFALHAVVLTCVNIYQISIYERGGQHLSTLAKGLAALITTLALFYALLVICIHGGPHLHGVGVFSWLSWLYFLSIVKLGVTLIKYIPQAKLNYDRKSTVGWSIENVLLDLTGGLLSIAQLMVDGATEGWSGVIGDPIKFGLGFISIFFDVLFMIQHYVLYTDRTDEATDGDRSSAVNTNIVDSPLLAKQQEAPYGSKKPPQRTNDDETRPALTIGQGHSGTEPGRGGEKAVV